MEKTQPEALLSAAADNHSKLGSWFSRVSRAPLVIVGAPPFSGMPDIKNHIIRIAGLGEQATDARKPPSRCVPQVLNRRSPSHGQILPPWSNVSLCAFAGVMLLPGGASRVSHTDR
jgi:hypothetical protein